MMESGQRANEERLVQIQTHHAIKSAVFIVIVVPGFAGAQVVVVSGEVGGAGSISAGQTVSATYTVAAVTACAASVARRIEELADARPHPVAPARDDSQGVVTFAKVVVSGIAVLVGNEA